MCFALGAMVVLLVRPNVAITSTVGDIQPAATTVAPVPRDPDGGSVDPSPTPKPPTAPTPGPSTQSIEIGEITTSRIISVNEPSGVTWSPSRAALWVVSDDETALSLVSTTGDVLTKIEIATSHDDWEGVAELPTGELLVVSETDRHILVIDPVERMVVRSIDLQALAMDRELVALLDTGGDNKGLEGITIGRDGSIWVVKEAEPILLIQLDLAMTRIVRWIDPTSRLAAASGLDPDELDLSGLTQDPTDDNVLWLASHKANALFRWDTNDDDVLSVHPVDTPKIEGITFSPDLRAYAVDDRTQQLLRLGEGEG